MRELSSSDKNNVQVLLTEMLTAANKGGNYVDNVVHQLTTIEHRTNQQTVMRELILPILKAWGEKENYDLRNEGTVKLCKEMNAIIEGAILPYI